ncbi:unnamed protein product, partial [Amoebophrya sp. A25]
VPGSLLLHETAKPGDHRFVQPLIIAGQMRARKRKSDPLSDHESSSDDEAEKRRKYNAAPPVRDQVYNLLKEVAPRQLAGGIVVGSGSSATSSPSRSAGKKVDFSKNPTSVDPSVVVAGIVENSPLLV